MPYLSESYIHDMDRMAFAALNTFPKFVKLVEAYHANFDEKAARIDLLSSAIRLSDKGKICPRSTKRCAPDASRRG